MSTTATAAERTVLDIVERAADMRAQNAKASSDTVEIICALNSLAWALANRSDLAHRDHLIAAGARILLALEACDALTLACESDE